MIVAKTTEEQRAAMQEAARLAFRSEANGQAETLMKAIRAEAAQVSKGFGPPMATYAGIAVVSAVLGAALVKLFGAA
ncbi:hypothetical protein FUT48_00005 [Pseudomonas sp. JG-B]|nr:hypothetical protein [Pseudomonas sp. JG-B]